MAPAVADLGSFTTGGRLATPAAPGGPVAELLDADAEVYAALVLGTRDYVTKNGFEHVVHRAVGRDRLDARGAHRRRRPRPRARDLRDDALAVLVARARAATPARWPRTSASSCSSCRSARRWRATTSCWRDVFAGREPDITEENLQARIRGNLLMALSNKFGWLVLTTGNKSEMSVGYSTLYGDSAGGFAVIKDVPKTLVYRLVAERARARPASRPCPSRSSRARRRPSCAPTSATRTRCRPTRCSTRSSRATSSRTSAASSSSRAACRRPTSTASSASSTSPSTSAARTRRASR